MTTKPSREQLDELDRTLRTMTETQLRMALRVTAFKRFEDVNVGVAVALMNLPSKPEQP